MVSPLQALIGWMPVTGLEWSPTIVDEKASVSVAGSEAEIKYATGPRVWPKNLTVRLNIN
jgi:hypothetical protein